MRRNLKTQVAITLMLHLVLFAGCGGNAALKSFRVALASSGPLVQSLAASGAIPAIRAREIIKDFDDGANCGIALSDAFKAASSLPKEQQRPAKFAASQTAFTCFRAIIQRQNFAQHQRLQDVANIAEGILASLVIFYSDGGPSMVAGEQTLKPSFTAQDEKELMKKMEAEMKKLERAMQP